MIHLHFILLRSSDINGYTFHLSKMANTMNSSTLKTSSTKSNTHEHVPNHCCDFFLQNQKVLPKDVMFHKLVLQDGELPRHPLVGFWQSLLHPKMLRESRFKVWTYWLRSLWKHLFVPRYYTPGPLFALF